MLINVRMLCDQSSMMLRSLGIDMIDFSIWSIGGPLGLHSLSLSEVLEGEGVG